MDSHYSSFQLLHHLFDKLSLSLSDLGFTELRILIFLKSLDKPSSQRNIQDFLEISPSKCTRAISRLEKKGRVKGVNDPLVEQFQALDNYKEKNVALTPFGHEVLDKVLMVNSIENGGISSAYINLSISNERPA